MFHRLLTPPLLFPLFHSTNGVPRRSPSQLFLLFTRFHDAPLVDLLPSHRRVPRKSHWFGSSSTRQDFIDSIATEQSVPLFLPPSLPRITFTRNFLLPGKFSDYHRGCLFYFVSLSLLFFPLKFYPLRFRISSFFRGLLFSLCGSCGFARSCILFLKYPLLPSSGPPEFDLLLLLG